MPTNPVPHILVTAGPTREKIDQVRDWGNIFTGQTGLDLALAFLDLGSVTLLTSNLDHARAYDGYSGKAGMLGAESFRSHADLHALLVERMTSGDRVDVVAMTAAVADYQPAGAYQIMRRDTGPVAGQETWTVQEVSAGKVKGHYDQIALRGMRTLKLIDQFRPVWGFKGLLIKFKLEVGLTEAQLIDVAEASRKAGSADLMVANTLAMARPESGEGSAILLDGGAPQRVTRGDLARQIVAWTRRRLALTAS